MTIDANELEQMAKERPDECFLKGSGVLKLTDAIRKLEREVAALKAQSAPTEAAQGEDSARLDWSSEQAPNSECCYHHVTAQTPFGRILITWKGWKDDPSPTVDEHPVAGYFYAGNDVADAKEAAERAYVDAIYRARASAETGGVKP